MASTMLLPLEEMQIPPFPGQTTTLDSSGIVELAQRESEVEEARSASSRLRQQLHDLAKLARERDEGRVLQLRGYDEDFSSLQTEAKDVEFELDQVFEAITALEAQIEQEPLVAKSEREALEAEFHDDLESLRAANVADRDRRKQPLEIIALREVLVETDEREAELNHAFEVSMKEVKMLQAKLEEATKQTLELSERKSCRDSPVRTGTIEMEPQDVALEIEHLHEEAAELRAVLESPEDMDESRVAETADIVDARQVLSTIAEYENAATALRIQSGVLDADIEQLQKQIEACALRAAAAAAREELYKSETAQVLKVDKEINESLLIKEEELIKAQRMAAVESTQIPQLCNADIVLDKKSETVTEDMLVSEANKDDIAAGASPQLETPADADLSQVPELIPIPPHHPLAKAKAWSQISSDAEADRNAALTDKVAANPPSTTALIDEITDSPPTFGSAELVAAETKDMQPLELESTKKQEEPPPLAGSPSVADSLTASVSPPSSPERSGSRSPLRPAGPSRASRASQVQAKESSRSQVTLAGGSCFAGPSSSSFAVPNRVQVLPKKTVVYSSCAPVTRSVTTFPVTTVPLSSMRKSSPPRYDRSRIIGIDK